MFHGTLVMMCRQCAGEQSLYPHYFYHFLAVECIDMDKRKIATFIVWFVMGHWRGEYTTDRSPNKECLVSYVV